MVLWLLRLHFRLRGWKVVRPLPQDIRRCIIVVAPHTSAWDFVYGTGAKLIMKLETQYLAKKELFRWPLRGLLQRLGGVAVDRSRRSGTTETLVALLNQQDPCRIVITPEGTRQRNSRWKTGYYNAALGAGVPIALAYLDYKRKEAGFGPVWMPSGNLNDDLAIIRQFYSGITARYPEKFALPE